MGKARYRGMRTRYLLPITEYKANSMVLRSLLLVYPPLPVELLRKRSPVLEGGLARCPDGILMPGIHNPYTTSRIRVGV